MERRKGGGGGSVRIYLEKQRRVKGFPVKGSKLLYTMNPTTREKFLRRLAVTYLRQPRSCLAFYIIFPLNFNYVAFIDDPAVVNSSKNVVFV